MLHQNWPFGGKKDHHMGDISHISGKSSPMKLLICFAVLVYFLHVNILGYADCTFLIPNL